MIRTWIVAKVVAILPDDWQGAAGEFFREAVQAISQFLQANGLQPGELLGEGIKLGGRKVTGVLSKEHAEAEKNYAEAAKAFTEIEDKKIEMELKRRVFESNVIKREAKARAAKAAAKIAETEAIGKWIDVLKKLDKNGMGLSKDEKGDLIVFPLRKGAANLLPSNPEPEQV